MVLNDGNSNLESFISQSVFRTVKLSLRKDGSLTAALLNKHAVARNKKARPSRLPSIPNYKTWQLTQLHDLISERVRTDFQISSPYFVGSISLRILYPLHIPHSRPKRQHNHPLLQGDLETLCFSHSAPPIRLYFETRGDLFEPETLYYNDP